MLKVNHLKQSFGENVILDDVSFSLKAGEIIGLVAPNGTGKSTLLHIIINFLQPNSGEVIIEKEGKVYDYRNEKNEVEMRKFISFLPELEHLYVDLSGRDHLNYYASMWGNSKKMINEVIERLDIASYVDTKVRTYSLGMRQRLAFAMVLCADTPIMLMDEVMNGLDPDNVNLITEILIELKERNKIVIIASHLLDNLDVYADQIMFIKNGKITLQAQETENEWKKQYLKLTLTDQEYEIIQAANLIPNDMQQMNQQLWIVPLKDMSKKQAREFIAQLIDLEIYDFTISKVGTQERYDYFYQN